MHSLTQERLITCININMWRHSLLFTDALSWVYHFNYITTLNTAFLAKPLVKVVHFWTGHRPNNINGSSLFHTGFQRHDKTLCACLIMHY